MEIQYIKSKEIIKEKNKTNRRLASNSSGPKTSLDLHN